MKTDELIHILSQAPRARARLNILVCGAALVIAGVVATKFMLGLRPEVMAFDFSRALLVKLAVLSLLAITAVQYLKEQSQPVARLRARYVAMAAYALLAGLVAHEWATVDHWQIMALFDLPNFPACLFFVGLYGLVGGAALTVHMQASAPADGGRAAAAIGFAACTTGAVGYALHCPVDSPTFIAVAYHIPVLAIAGLARLVLPRFLRW